MHPIPIRASIPLRSDPWEGVFTSLVSSLGVPPAHAARVAYIDSAAEAVKAISHHYGEAGAGAGAVAEAGVDT